MYLYDEAKESFGKVPYTVVGATTNNNDGEGDFGAEILFQGDRLWSGAPKSSYMVPGVGGVLRVSQVD